MQKPGSTTIGWVFAIVLLSLTPAGASITTPVLALTRVSTAVGPFHEVLNLEAVFPHGGLVQASFTLWVLVRPLDAGGAFWLYELPGTVSEGVSALLDDGLQDDDIPVLVSVGAESADGRVLFLGRSRIDLRLSVSFPVGPAEAQLLLFDSEGVVLSNPVRFDVMGVDASGEMP